MATYKVLAIFGFLLVNITIVIQSAPVEKAKDTVQTSLADQKSLIEQALLKPLDSEKTSSTPSSTVSQSTSSTPKPALEKKKRDIEDDLLDGTLDSESDEEDVALNKNHVLHARIQETSSKVHDNADKPADIDDSKVFSDIKMTPNELMNIRRRRRDVKFNDRSNQRRKRALSPYDFYDTDSFYDPYGDLLEQEQYDRPIRSFAPVYWYPTAYERDVRSGLAPSFYESSEWPRLYSGTIDDDESEENPVDDDEEDYELNRYPILLQSSDGPLDNFELQQQYNPDDLPIDENEENSNLFDDDEGEEEEYYPSYSTERQPRLWIVQSVRFD